MTRWTKSERERRKQVERGETVVSNLKLDHNLIAWAKKTNCYVYIGRPGRWGNPYPIREGCDRAQCIAKFRQYFAKKPDLHERLASLKGKVLSCYCHPEPCHGHELVKYLAEFAVVS